MSGAPVLGINLGVCIVKISATTAAGPAAENCPAMPLQFNKKELA